jgi:hypothetical protein
MKRYPWEADSRSVDQEIPNHYGTQSFITVFIISQSLLSILSQYNSFHALKSYFFNAYFNIIL